jgi:hypothetical protein
MRFRASSSLLANYFTIPAGQSLSINLLATTVGYLEPLNAGDVAECIGFFGISSAKVIGGGTNLEILNISLTGGDDAVTFSQPVNGYILRSRNGIGVQVRAAAGATSWFTVPGSQFFSASQGPSRTPIYVRRTGGADVLEVIGIFGLD